MQQLLNGIVCYKPGDNITVDEQLFPTKACCRFIHGQQTGQNLGSNFGLLLIWNLNIYQTPYHILAKMKPDQLHKDCPKVW